MLVVSDATPLNVLVRVGVVEVLHALYDRVVIPPAVERELSHSSTPSDVRQWLESRPPWLAVIRPSSAAAGVGPDSGEREAIALALELGADFLLADDKAARSEARKLGIHVTGTIGVLQLAAQRNLLELPSSLSRLIEIGFYIDPEVVRSVVEADDLRHRTEDKQ